MDPVGVAALRAILSSSKKQGGADEVAEALRSLVAFHSIVCVDPGLLLRALEVYETERIDFAAAYLIACAESTGVGKVASFDRSIDRVDTIERIEPPHT
jgi:predicted nucleic acid-binding protein